MNKYADHIPFCGGEQECDRRRRRWARIFGRNMDRMMKSIALALGLVGCSQTNISEYTKALVDSQRAFCAILNAGPYGGGTVAAGSPDTSVQVSASGCNIQGSHVTTVTVPTGNVQVIQPVTPK